MQPVRLKSRPAPTSRPQAAPAAAPAAPAARRRRRRLNPLLLLVLALAGLAWGGVATWLLFEEKAQTASLRQEQAALQASYDERVKVWQRRLVGAILTQGSGSGVATPGSEAAQDGLADLITRQVELETRQSLLGALAGQALAPVLPPRGAQIPGNLLERIDPASAVPQRRQTAALQRSAEPLPLPERMALLQASLDRVEAAQGQHVSLLGVGLAAKVQEVRAALGELGLDPAKVKLPPARAAMGGPLIPVSAALKPGSFEQRLLQLGEAQALYGRWRDLAAIVPLQRPLDGDDSTTSNFGVRSDPFTGASTMHAGMDFRAETGTPIRAGGAGKVLRAEVAGGYGNLVELDHGNGLTTRYGHLSAFDVKPGDIVPAGTVIGRAGSTGRSTGPHLHYETRRDDAPLNPLIFIKLGERLAK